MIIGGQEIIAAFALRLKTYLTVGVHSLFAIGVSRMYEHAQAHAVVVLLPPVEESTTSCSIRWCSVGGENTQKKNDLCR